MPIDEDFVKKLRVTGTHAGHDVRGQINLPSQLGIHGTQVAVDQDVCIGDSMCVSVCPVAVFEMVKSPGHLNSEEKSDPVNESACIFCRACEASCPTEAIKITEP